MGVLGYREGGARACVESLLREGSEASGHELDHGDVDSGFRSLRASLKVFAQPAFKGFAQVTPQTAVDGLARTAALPYLEVAVNGPKCPRVARQQTPLAARAQTVADRVEHRVHSRYPQLPVRFRGWDQRRADHPSLVGPVDRVQLAQRTLRH